MSGYHKAIDLTGKALLIWFVFETIKYLSSGKLLVVHKTVSHMFDDGYYFQAIYSTLQAPIAAFGVFILIPLLLKGNFGGLVLGLLYWVMGNIINPLWFIVPYEHQITQQGKATWILITINFIWAAFTFITIIAFFFLRRALKVAKIQIPASCTQPIHPADAAEPRR